MATLKTVDYLEEKLGLRNFRTQENDNEISVTLTNGDNIKVHTLFQYVHHQSSVNIGIHIHTLLTIS